MRLIIDDINQIYVWVDNEDPEKRLSPHFDYLEDALQWKRNKENNLWDHYSDLPSTESYKK